MARTRDTSPTRTDLLTKVAADYQAGDSIRAVATRHGYSYGGMRALLIQARVTFRPRGFRKAAR